MLGLQKSISPKLEEKADQKDCWLIWDQNIGTIDVSQLLAVNENMLEYVIS